MLTSLRFVAILLLGIASVSLMALCLPAIFTRHDLSHPESMIPWAVKLVADGEPLFSDWREWPHRFMPYGPLLCYPAGLYFRLTGLPADGFHFYLFGRLQSFIYLVGVAVMISLMLPTRRWVAVLFGLACLALWPGLMIPGMSFRGDIPALFWSLAAANIAFRLPFSPRAVGLTLLLFMLSLAYRPALWSFPAAFFLFLALSGRVKYAIVWGGSVASAVATYMVVGHVITDGRFLLNQIGASSIGLTTDIYKLAFTLLTSRQEFPLITWDLVTRMAVAVPVAGFLFCKSRHSLDKGVALYFLVSLAVNLLTLFKVGAGLNYIIEAYVLSIVVLGIALLRVWQSREALSSAAIYGVGAGALALLAGPMVYFSVFNFKTVPQILKGIPAPAAYAPVRELPATALLGDLSFTHPDDSVHALSDPVPYFKLTARGRISKDPLVSRLKDKVFSHIVLSPGTKYQFFGPDGGSWAGAALSANYILQTELPEYEIWIPADTAAASPDNPAAPHGVPNSLP